MNFDETLIIAVDFDGTIVEDRYPDIGPPNIFAFETLEKLQNKGHRLILWTYRNGKRLQEAVEFCKENGIEFYAINESYVNEPMSKKISRKINADLFIDDRNIGGFLGWGEIYQLLTKEEPDLSKYNKKKGIFSIFNKRK